MLFHISCYVRSYMSFTNKQCHFMYFWKERVRSYWLFEIVFQSEFSSKLFQSAQEPAEKIEVFDASLVQIQNRSCTFQGLHATLGRSSKGQRLSHTIFTPSIPLFCQINCSQRVNGRMPSINQ